MAEKNMETMTEATDAGENAEIRKHVVKSSKLIITASDDSDIWNADWNIALAKEPEKKIGTISFVGEKVLGAVPIHVELEEAYRNHGYGTEAVSMMTSWAFHFKNIYEIVTESDRENDKWIKVLKKNGFVYRDSEGRTERYSCVKPKTAWTGLYLFIGIFLGLILGIVLAHVKTGLIIGVVIGLIFGLSLDSKANKERESVTGKRIK